MILLRYGYLNDLLQERQLPLAVPIAVGVGLAVALASVIAMVPVRQPVPDNVTVATKADKPTINPDTKTVRTIEISRLPQPVVVAPAMLPDPVPQPSEPTLQTTQTTRAGRGMAEHGVAGHSEAMQGNYPVDVCRKHGGYKEVRGRSWHCVYGKNR